ncbi:hypothetical protein [Spiroplasma alleghenense]|uniref:Uncharacterized protein n=1 Tax=Spiroplasma alleghenense TaxID=216931 RepID=A0A345Z3I6_9MOLU|nr:hypothetical protein [Spiroplasma alleghenense]AXK51165.1 hypothetical protein SALLE_v1c04910 [Spiroplasma alleghenense]
MEKKIKKVTSALIYSNDFIKQWLNEDSFTYLDFHTNKKYRINLDNNPLIKVLFESDDSFDIEEVMNQFNKISQEARFIIEEKIEGKKNPELNGFDVLFLRYFFFLISILNGDYRFRDDASDEIYCFLDILTKEMNDDTKHNLLLILNYILFELYDLLFTNRLFAYLKKYVDRYEGQSLGSEEDKIIHIKAEDFENQDFTYIEIYFHHIVNNNFMKIFKISEFEKENFLLNNQMIGNFVDNESQMALLSIMIINPDLAIGFINLGPGKGEFRPLFDYIQNNSINIEKIPSILHPNHRVILDAENRGERNKFIFKPLLLNKEQIQMFNFAISIKGIKIALEDLTNKN